MSDINALLARLMSHRTSELDWWHREFLTRISPDSDYIPNPGDRDALLGRRFRIVEDK